MLGQKPEASMKSSPVPHITLCWNLAADMDQAKVLLYSHLNAALACEVLPCSKLNSA